MTVTEININRRYDGHRDQPQPLLRQLPPLLTVLGPQVGEVQGDRVQREGAGGGGGVTCEERSYSAGTSDTTDNIVTAKHILHSADTAHYRPAGIPLEADTAGLALLPVLGEGVLPQDLLAEGEESGDAGYIGGWDHGDCAGGTDGSGGGCMTGGRNHASGASSAGGNSHLKWKIARCWSSSWPPGNLLGWGQR